MGSTPLPWQTTPWPKGGGKGQEQRACYTCGQTGHLARDCPSQRQVNEVGEALQEPEVLFIGDIGIFEKPKKVVKKKKKVEIKEQLVTGGMFEILGSEADFKTAIKVEEDVLRRCWEVLRSSVGRPPVDNDDGQEDNNNHNTYGHRRAPKNKARAKMD